METSDGKESLNKRRAIIGLLKLILAIAALIWLLNAGRLSLAALDNVANTWQWIFLALLLFGIVQVMTAIRWRWLLTIAGIDCGLAQTFKVTLAGLFFNQVFLGAIGGDIYRATALKLDRDNERADVVVSVIMDRIIGLYATILLVSLAALANLSLVRTHAVLQLVVGLTIILFLLIPLLFWFGDSKGFMWQRDNDRRSTGRLSIFIGSVIKSYRAYRGRKAMLWQVFIFSVMIQVLIVSTNILLAFGLLGLEIDWWPFFLLIPIAHLGMAIPMNPPGALGTGEALYSLLLSMVGITQGAFISLLQRLINIIWALPGLLALVLSARRAAPAAVRTAVNNDSPGQDES